MLYKKQNKRTKHIKECSSFNAYANTVFIYSAVATG